MIVCSRPCQCASLCVQVYSGITASCECDSEDEAAGPVGDPRHRGRSRDRASPEQPLDIPRARMLLADPPAAPLSECAVLVWPRVGLRSYPLGARVRSASVTACRVAELSLWVRWCW